MVKHRKMSKKIVMLGDAGVGKTSMIRKFVYDIFDDKYISTLGMKVTKKDLCIKHPIEDSKVDMTMMIWDLMGQKEYETLHKSTYEGTHGALVVSDITRYETLDNLAEWISDLYNVTGNIPVILIGNKNDLIEQRKFELLELEKIAKTCKGSAFLTSAKTGDNVEKVFSKLSQEILKFDSSRGY